DKELWIRNHCVGAAGCGFIPRRSRPRGTDGGRRDRAGRRWTGKGDMSRQRMHIYYSGHVQGVGFRYTVKTVATGFEVSGTVRNLPDGRVELKAEGRQEELEAFRQAIRKSGLENLIAEEAVVWGEAQNEFRGFEIV